MRSAAVAVVGDPDGEVGAGEPEPSADLHVGQLPRAHQLIERAPRHMKELGSLARVEQRLG